MNRIFKKAVISFFGNKFRKEIPEFRERKLTKTEKARYAVAPILVFSEHSEPIEYFVAFLGYKDSQIIVELGWKRGEVFPPCAGELLVYNDKVLSDVFDWPRTDFAIRLPFLCPERRPGIVPWELYDPEVWDHARETYQEFKERQDCLQSVAIELEWTRRGGVTEEYATSQAELIGGDIMGCLHSYGIPFLREAMRRHMDDVSD